MAVLATDVSDLLLGDDNDIVVGTDIGLTRGLDGIAQGCRVAVQMFAEEWFLDLDVGIPYLQSILGQRQTVGVVSANAAFRRELLAVRGVLAVIKVEVTFDSATRALTVVWQVRTELGETPADSISVSTSGGIS